MITSGGATHMYRNDILEWSNYEFLTDATSVLMVDPLKVASKFVDHTPSEGSKYTS